MASLREIFIGDFFKKKCMVDTGVFSDLREAPNERLTLV